MSTYRSAKSLHPKETRERIINHSLRPKAIRPQIHKLQQHRTAQSQMRDELKDQTLYDLLEIEPYTPEEEIRKSYKGLRERFDPNRMVAYGLYSRAQSEALIKELDQAFQILIDPMQRQAYDQNTFPDGLPSIKSIQDHDNAFSMRIQPLISESNINDRIAGKMITGSLLKDLRDYFNISIDELHERTKITRHTLHCIEIEDYESLPALVYLRGFLKEIAKALSLPIERCVHEYSQGYQSWYERSL
jgi:curved DNA-binding protein CbpA